MHRHRELSPAARTALADAQINGLALVLPDHLARPVYLEVVTALKALGGKWTRSVKAHIFDQDPTAGIELAVETGRMPEDLAKLASWWPTPAGLAARVARTAVGDFGRLPDWGGRVLEPSAGEGALLSAVRAVAPAADLFAVEADIARARFLHEQGYEVVCARFEDWAEDFPWARFDVIVMNPPFTVLGDRLAWLTHVEVALGLLAPLGRLAAILPRSVAFRQGARFERLRGLAAKHGSVEALPDGSFREVGTDVHTSLLVVQAPETVDSWLT